MEDAEEITLSSITTRVLTENFLLWSFQPCANLNQTHVHVNFLLIPLFILIRMYGKVASYVFHDLFGKI